MFSPECLADATSPGKAGKFSGGQPRDTPTTGLCNASGLRERHEKLGEVAAGGWGGRGGCKRQQWVKCLGLKPQSAETLKHL